MKYELTVFQYVQICDQKRMELRWLYESQQTNQKALLFFADVTGFYTLVNIMDSRYAPGGVQRQIASLQKKIGWKTKQKKTKTQ